MNLNMIKHKVYKNLKHTQIKMILYKKPSLQKCTSHYRNPSIIGTYLDLRDRLTHSGKSHNGTLSFTALMI